MGTAFIRMLEVEIEAVRYFPTTEILPFVNAQCEGKGRTVFCNVFHIQNISEFQHCWIFFAIQVAREFDYFIFDIAISNGKFNDDAEINSIYEDS